MQPGLLRLLVRHLHDAMLIFNFAEQCLIIKLGVVLSILLLLNIVVIMGVIVATQRFECQIVQGFRHLNWTFTIGELRWLELDHFRGDIIVLGSIETSLGSVVLLQQITLIFIVFKVLKYATVIFLTILVQSSCVGEEICSGFPWITRHLKSLDIIIRWDIWSILSELLATGIPTEICQGSI